MRQLYSADNPQTYPQILWISQYPLQRCRARRRRGAAFAAAAETCRGATVWLKVRADAATITIRKRVVRHHPGRRLADLVPAARFRHRRGPDHRALDLAARPQDHAADAARAGGRASTSARACRDEVLDKLAKDSPLGAVLAAGLRNHKQLALRDEGGDRGGRARRGARPGALPHHAGHHRHRGAAARPVRHGDRHDRDLRLAVARPAPTRSSSRTASRSRSTTPPSASPSPSRR